MDGGQARASNAAPRGQAAAGAERGCARQAASALRKRAREDAARNLPRHDADDLSAAERAVIEAVAGERARVDQARNEAKAEAERRLRALAPTPQDFSGPALDARLALKQAAGRLAHDWSEAAAPRRAGARRPRRVQARQRPAPRRRLSALDAAAGGPAVLRGRVRSAVQRRLVRRGRRARPARRRHHRDRALRRQRHARLSRRLSGLALPAARRACRSKRLGALAFRRARRCSR